MSFLKRLKKPSEQMSKETRKFRKVSAVLEAPSLEDFSEGITKGKWTRDSTLLQIKSHEVLYKDKYGFTEYVKVPEKFFFDGASIPVGLQWLVGAPHAPRFLIAAYFHDFLYSRGKFDRQFADELFYLLLRKYGVSSAKASLFFLGVRTFGIIFKK